MVPIFLVLLPIFAFAAPPSPFGSISSAEDNSIFDPFSSFSNDRSQLPGVQVYPSLAASQMPIQSLTGNFMRQRSLGSTGTDSMNLETWTKNHAVRMNQENALIAQLSKMAPHRRNQLVRDVTNGNASAANELVTRLLRDLASSPHGQLAFGGQLQQQAALHSMLDQSGGMNSLQNGFASSQFPQGINGASLPLSLQLQMLANQRQMLLNGGQNRMPFLNNQQQINGAFMPSIGTATNSILNPSQKSQIMNDRLLRQQLLMLQTRSAISPQTNSFFPNNAIDFSDLSRPDSPFSSGSQQQQAFTQLSPFSQSQSQPISGIGRIVQGNGNNINDFSKTLSGASNPSSSFSNNFASSTPSSPFNGAFLRGLDDRNGNNEGRFVDDLDPEELFEKRFSGTTTGVGTVQRKRSRMLSEANGVKSAWKALGQKSRK